MEELEDFLKSLRAYRDDYARRFNYDLEAIHRDMTQQQEQLRAEGWRMVSLEPLATADIAKTNIPQPEPRAEDLPTTGKAVDPVSASDAMAPLS